MRLDPTRVPVFQDRLAPDQTRLVGWAALTHALAIQAPVRRPSCVSDRHVRGSQRTEETWRVFDRRYWPGDEVAEHLTFALRHEDLDLLILKRVFAAVPVSALEEMVRAAPTGLASRRIWFLYEWLTGKTLDARDAPNAAAIDLLDPAAYFAAEPRLSRRHRVRDNLLGTARFCPLMRRTKALMQFVDQKLAETARGAIGRSGAHLVARAASFMLLADSQASFAIEGERPPRNRIERWGRAVLEAGRRKLALDEIMRLHRILLADTRFVQPGLRPDGVFLGERDHHGDPMPEFVGARPADLPDLMQGLIEANDRMLETELDPVLQAAATAFGFVYIHPLQDGNGRLHRCLIHHVLAARQFTPSGMIFPVSSVMLDRIEAYRATLRAHSGPLMAFIEWRPTPDRNVEVLNDTADLYRYFDCTDAAEFLYACTERTVKHDLPREIDYLRRHDDAIRRIMDAVEMPDRVAETLVMFIRQNGGALPRKRRQTEFKALNDEEVERLQDIVRDAFDGFDAFSASTPPATPSYG